MTGLPHTFQADTSMPDDQELLGHIVKQFCPMQNNGVHLAVPSLVVLFSSFHYQIVPIWFTTTSRMLSMLLDRGTNVILIN